MYIFSGNMMNKEPKFVEKKRTNIRIHLGRMIKQELNTVATSNERNRKSITIIT